MNYRNEINGLRAIAVTSVILFHAGFEQFKGGFLGVDVFFVISGFLITSIILDALANNKFSFTEFYARRARRILPALLMLLAVCILPAWLLLFPDQMNLFATSLGCAAVFISNVFYMTQAGYFAPNALEDPLIHLWTLSIEEQFYLFSPALIVLVWKYAQRMLNATLVALLVASVVYGYGKSFQSPDATFFNSIARAWELLFGSLTASLVRNTKVANPVGPLLRNVLSSVALLLIFVCVATSSENIGFPSLPYYITIGSTAAFLWLGNEKTWVGKLLTLRPVAHIGMISYSAYLWHQPILAFARIIWNVEQIPAFRYLILTPIFVAAHLSWKYVENPFKHPGWNGWRRWGLVASVIALFSFGVAGNLTVGFEKWHSSHIPESVQKTFDDIPIKLECTSGAGKLPSGTEFCTFGSQNTAPSIAVFGDSHSFPLRAVFDEIGREYKLGIVHNGLGGCPPLANIYVLNGNHPPFVCHDLVEQQIAYVRSHAIKDVFFAVRWSMYTDGSYRKGSKIYLLSEKADGQSDQGKSREALRTGIKTTIDIYRSMGVHVHLLTQAPMQLYNPKHIYARWHDQNSSAFGATLRKFSVPYSVHSEHQRFARSILLTDFRDTDARVIDMDKFFCDTMYCLVGTSELSYYHDDDHLSSYGAMKIKPALVDELKLGSY